MPIATKPFDPKRYLPDEAAREDLLADARESGHAGYRSAAIEAVAEARRRERAAAETSGSA